MLSFWCMSVIEWWFVTEFICSSFKTQAYVKMSSITDFVKSWHSFISMHFILFRWFYLQISECRADSEVRSTNTNRLRRVNQKMWLATLFEFTTILNHSVWGKCLSSCIKCKNESGDIFNSDKLTFMMLSVWSQYNQICKCLEGFPAFAKTSAWIHYWCILSCCN